MRKLGFISRIATIIFLWIIASGALIRHDFFIAVLSMFLGCWLIAMPDHYRKGRKKMAWVVFWLGLFALVLLMQWRGMAGP